jgi:solute carrier family 12 (sodium/potassium/chloride transporter), member 2
MALNMYISLQFYNKWLSLFGCILCIVIMFFLAWKSAMITVLIIIGLYLVVMYRQPDANWGSSTQEQTYRTLISAAHRLQQTGDHIKNYHPQVLVLAGNPLTRPALIDLGSVITKNTSLFMVGDIFETKLSFRSRTEMVAETYRYFDANKMKAFYNLIDDVDMETGVKLMIQSSGFGTLSPNILLMGYKNDWASCGYTTLNTYFKVLQ